jgi:pimeloyl-ACP methyl ester carboxylesterase
MHRPQRRLALLLAMVTAAAVTMFTAAPAGAAGKPSRSDGSGNRVIFVHGFTPGGSHDCAKTFSTARKHFADNGWRGNLLTFGYYAGNENCSYTYKGNRNTSLKEVAEHFANYVSQHYSQNNKKVDVVAHSMGGLVVRAALHYTHEREEGFPDKLYIEDVVTLGTPHAGMTKSRATICLKLRQCTDMKQGSAFLRGLPDRMPSTTRNGNMRTDWTTVSSFDDGTVSESSGIAGTADHEVQYDAGVNHGQLVEKSSGKHYGRIKYSTTWTTWHQRISPVEQARLSVFKHSTI